MKQPPSKSTCLFSQLLGLYFPHRINFQIVTGTDGWWTNPFLFVHTIHLRTAMCISVQANKRLKSAVWSLGKFVFLM